MWVSVGNFTFTDTSQVKIQCSGGGSVVADAVKFAMINTAFSNPTPSLSVSPSFPEADVSSSSTTSPAISSSRPPDMGGGVSESPLPSEVSVDVSFVPEVSTTSTVSRTPALSKSPSRSVGSGRGGNSGDGKPSTVIITIATGVGTAGIAIGILVAGFCCRRNRDKKKSREGGKTNGDAVPSKRKKVVTITAPAEEDDVEKGIQLPIVMVKETTGTDKSKTTTAASQPAPHSLSRSVRPSDQKDPKNQNEMKEQKGQRDPRNKEAVVDPQPTGIKHSISLMISGRQAATFTSGTFQEWVIWLIDRDPSDRPKNAETFLFTYGIFKSSQFLFSCLRDQFTATITSGANHSTVNDRLLRILEVLALWMDCSFDDFTQSRGLLQQIGSFLDSEVKPNIQLLPGVTAVRRAIDRNSEAIRQYVQHWDKTMVSGSNSLAVNQRRDILKYSDEDIAKQLTLATISMMKITPQNEFLHHSFNNANNITSLMLRLDMIRLWVTTQILLRKDLNQRVLVMEKFIRVAVYCVDNLQNLQDTKAIVSGLASPAITRLKATQEEIFRDDRDDLKRLTALVNYENHYGKAKAWLAAQPRLAVPYIGVYLRDLAEIEKVAPNYVDGLEQVINFDKCRRLHALVSHFKLCKQLILGIERMDELFFQLIDLPFLKEEDLLDMSYRREESKRKDQDRAAPPPQKRRDPASRVRESMSNSQDHIRRKK